MNIIEKIKAEIALAGEKTGNYVDANSTYTSVRAAGKKEGLEKALALLEGVFESSNSTESKPEFPKASIGFHVGNATKQYDAKNLFDGLGLGKLETVTVEKGNTSIFATICVDPKYPGIDIDGKDGERLLYLANVELPNEDQPAIASRLYAGDAETETDSPIAMVLDYRRMAFDNTKRVIYIDQRLSEAREYDDGSRIHKMASTVAQQNWCDYGEYPIISAQGDYVRLNNYRCRNILDVFDNEKTFIGSIRLEDNYQFFDNSDKRLEELIESLTKFRMEGQEVVTRVLALFPAY